MFRTSNIRGGNSDRRVSLPVFPRRRSKRGGTPIETRIRNRGGVTMKSRLEFITAVFLIALGLLIIGAFAIQLLAPPEPPHELTPEEKRHLTPLSPYLGGKSLIFTVRATCYLSACRVVRSLFAIRDTSTARYAVDGRDVVSYCGPIRFVAVSVLNINPKVWIGTGARRVSSRAAGAREINLLFGGASSCGRRRVALLLALGFEKHTRKNSRRRRVHVEHHTNTP